MARIVLKKDIIKKIQNDPVLFGKIAAALNLKPVTIPKLLTSRHSKLTQADVLATLKEHLNISQDSDLLETIGEDDSDNIGTTKFLGQSAPVSQAFLS